MRHAEQSPGILVQSCGKISSRTFGLVEKMHRQKQHNKLEFYMVTGRENL